MAHVSRKIHTTHVCCCTVCTTSGCTFHQWRRKEFESGTPVRSEVPEKNFCWSCPSTLLALNVQLVVLVSAFVMVITVWSVSCLLFFYSLCSPYPAICKIGGHVPPCPMESAPLIALTIRVDIPSLTTPKICICKG